MCLYVQTRDLHLPSVGYLHQLGETCIRCKRACTTCKNMHAVQPSESTQFGTNGRALSYKWGTPIINIWGTHCRTNGGCVSHPRRAHNLVQIIVCYNYHSAELRVSGLPKMALWYICTFGLWHICISSFPLLSYKWGTPIISIWGTHYRTNGGRCHRCTFLPLLRPLSYRWGMIVVQMGDAATDAPLRSPRMCLENVVHLPLKVEKKHIDNIRPPRECASGSERTPVPS